MKIVVIGNGKMAADCIKMMLNQTHHQLSYVFFEADMNVQPKVLLDCIEENQIPSSAIIKIHDEVNLKVLDELQPDWIFNINCYQYLRPIVLSKAKCGVINFHNGPLPRYGGVNIPAWVILNGEQQHGVTWHLVNEAIDAGAILEQSSFELSSKVTAAQLMVKCIQEGIRLFEENWIQWIEGKTKPRVQIGERLYFGLKDKVPNGGLLSANNTNVDWDRTVRALHLFPYPNDFAYAHIRIQHQKYFAIAGKIIDNNISHPIGTITLDQPIGFAVQLSNGHYLITQLADEEWKLIKPIDLALICGSSSSMIE
jgi:methionyl-tRNA formyltransferase